MIGTAAAKLRMAQAKIEELEAEVAKLTAERDRLKGALKELASIADDIARYANIGTMDEAIDRARDALKGGDARAE